METTSRICFALIRTSITGKAFKSPHFSQGRFRSDKHQLQSACLRSKQISFLTLQRRLNAQVDCRNRSYWAVSSTGFYFNERSPKYVRTHRQGSSVVEFLLKAPTDTFSIRAITRNPSSPAAQALATRGIEIVQADLASLEQTTKAFEGAWGVFGVTQFYEHGFEAEQLHGKHIVEAAKVAKVKHIVWSTVEGRDGECGATSWRSKALIEDRVIASGIPYTFVYIPMYYENFWTSFFAPSYDEQKGFNWSVAFLPDVPIFAFSVADLGGLVVLAFSEPEKYNGTADSFFAKFP